MRERKRKRERASELALQYSLSWSDLEDGCWCPFGAFPDPSNLLCLSQSLWRTCTAVPTITWASWGLPLFKAKTQGVLHPAANQQWHLLTADLPFGAPSWPLSWPSCSYANIFLAANPETDLSHITGHLHQKDEIRHSKCLKLVEMRKKGVFVCFLFVRSSVLFYLSSYEKHF